MAYAHSDTNTALNNSTFFNYTIANRSDTDYHDFYIALWIDFELGYAFDDYVGCDTNLNAVYVYNGDSVDDGVLGYGKNPPAQGMVFLNAPLKRFIAYNNDFSKAGNPTEVKHYYNYLKAKWKDGTSLMYGSDGVQGTIPTNHMYSGDPVGSVGWTEGSVMNPPGDRRGLAGIGPFTLKKGQYVCFDLAFVYARDTANRWASVNKLKSEIKRVKDFYNSQNYNCSYQPTGFEKTSRKISSLKVFPNPAGESLYFSLEESARGFVKVCIVELGGRVVKTLTVQGGQDNSIDISNLPSGMYILKAEIKNQTATAKFVKR